MGGTTVCALTAIDLVKLAAYGYCRKPPSIRDLKTLLAARTRILLKRKLTPYSNKFEERVIAVTA